MANAPEWTQSNITSGSIRSIYYTDGLWVTGDYTSGGLYYSTDGQTWTQSNITSESIISIYNANGIWIACGTASHFYSTDGMAWTERNNRTRNYSAFYGNGLWILGCDRGYYYSNDGTNWYQTSFNNKPFYSMHYANNLWVAGTINATNGNCICYSTDGKSWTQSNITSTTRSESYQVIGYFNGLWVAGSMWDGLYYSTDGKSWNQSNIIDATIRSIYYTDGLWVAGGDDSLYYYSTDGQTWTQSNITSECFYSIYNANGVWVAGSDDGLYYSKFTPPINKVEYAGELLIDLTADTVTADTLKSGATAHDASGATITGTLTISEEQTKNIDLNMSSGNQIIKPDNGKVLSQATIMKPSTMLPENIKKDVNIGGVVGTLESGGSGNQGEVWVFDEIPIADGIGFDETIQVPFISNGVKHNGITYSGDYYDEYNADVLLYDDTVVARILGDLGIVWLDEKYRKLIFNTPITEDSDNIQIQKMYSFLSEPNLLDIPNATKQPSDVALQPSKSVEITANGTTTVTPDVPYDGLQSVEVVANVEGSSDINTYTIAWHYPID